MAHLKLTGLHLGCYLHPKRGFNSYLKDIFLQKMEGYELAS